MKYVVFANNRVGLEGLRLMKAAGIEVVGLVVHPPESGRYRDELIAASELPPEAIFNADQLRDPGALGRMKQLGAEIGLSLFFGYILRPPVLAIFPRGVLNLHPSLLPKGRGCFPNVWSIVDRFPAGVSLHLIDEGVDTGPVITQLAVQTELWDTGASLYARLEAACLKLLSDSLAILKSGSFQPVPQSGTHRTYKGIDVNSIDRIDLDKSYTGRELIDILRARTFPPHKGAYFVDENGVRVDLRLELIPDFSQSSTDGAPASSDVESIPQVAVNAPKTLGTYVFAGCKPWHREAFERLRVAVPADWHFVSAPDQLTLKRIRELAPRYIFFTHWSWKVPTDLTDAFECVCFHVGDLPKDRGGSPVQNQIAKGNRSSFLCALRMVQELDAGPVYTKNPLSLEGGGEEIFLRMTEETLRIIEWIVREEPTPIPQTGAPEFLPRRKPAQSQLDGAQSSLLAVHDHIRMLDAAGYPKAFIELGNLRLEFSRSALYHDHVAADVRISLKPQDAKESQR